MKRINSRAKGARGERAWASFLCEAGFPSKRGVQHSGRDAETGQDNPDVVCPSLKWLHFEVKAVERLNIQDAMSQAERDANDKVPVVAHKKNNSPWLVTLPADVFMQFLRGDLPPEENTLEKKMVGHRMSHTLCNTKHEPRKSA
jgi:Holliday junction resolvase